MELVLERSHNAEVAAAPAQAPEEIRMLCRTGPQALAIGGHHIRRHQVVAGQAIFPLEPAETAAQGEARDPRRGIGAAGGRQAEHLRLTVQLAPGDPALGAHRAPGRIDPDTLHRGQVNDDPAVAGGVAGDVVATPTHRHQQVMGTGKTDRREDIRHTRATHDHGRMAVDHPIPHLAGLLIADIIGTQQRAPQTRFEIVNDRCLEDGILEARPSL